MVQKRDGSAGDQRFVMISWRNMERMTMSLVGDEDGLNKLPVGHEVFVGGDTDGIQVAGGKQDSYRWLLEPVT